MKKRVTGLGGVFFKCRDPEGNKIELWEPMEKSNLLKIKAEE